MKRVGAGLAIACAAACVPSVALADRVAILPSTGASAEITQHLDADVTAGVEALGHVVVAAADVKAALADPAFAKIDGVAVKWDQDSLLALGKKLKADWVIRATDEPAVRSERVEIGAAYESIARYELVAREVDKDGSAPEIKEMLGVLLRPEGVGTGELPWEKAPTPVKNDHPDNTQTTVTVIAPPPDKPAEPEKPRAPYGGGFTGFVTAGFGVDGLVVTPTGAQGNKASFVGVLRGGFVIGTTALEPYAQLGGHLAGPGAVWLEVGARWMGIGAITGEGPLGLHFGPSLHGGVYIVPGSSTTAPNGEVFESATHATGTIALSFDGALRLANRVQLDAQLGELRLVPLETGLTMSLGANLLGGVRF